MHFSVLKATSDGKLLCKSDGGEPVSRPVKLFAASKEVGVLKETIGRVSNPLYVGMLKDEFRKKYLSFEHADLDSR